MFQSRRLACSFCGKGAAEVSKLVAGPRVFICEGCVAEATRIMSTPNVPAREAPLAKRSLLRRLFGHLRKVGSPVLRMRAYRSAAVGG